MLKTLSCIWVMTVLLFTTSANAEIFKWVDANGVTHYSDKAPKKRVSKPVKLHGTKAKTNVAQKRKAKRQQKTVAPKPRHSKQVIQRSKRTIRKQLAKQQRIKQKAKRKQRQPRNKPVYDLELIGTPKQSPKPRPVSAPLPQVALANQTQDESIAPDLDSVEYDIRQQDQQLERVQTLSIKQKLCQTSRTLLAALKEDEFKGYYDDQGSYRVVWGGDAIYQGKRRYLTPIQKTKKLKETELEVEQYCEQPYDLAIQETARANWIRAEYCKVSKAFLEEMQHPFLRTSDDEISAQTDEVERYCAVLEPGQYRDDESYFPKALKPRIYSKFLPDDEEELKTKIAEKPAPTPTETMEQLLALIEN